MTVLQEALSVAKKNKISTVVVASTSGDTALKLFELVKDSRIRMIVVTHDEGKPPQERRFSEDIRIRLLANNITVYTHNPRNILLRKIIGKILDRLGFSSWHKHLREARGKFGTGIKVCHIIVQMLMEGGILRDGKVMAIAGTKKGADSAAVFLLKPQSRRPILEEIIVRPGVIF